MKSECLSILIQIVIAPVAKRDFSDLGIGTHGLRNGTFLDNLLVNLSFTTLFTTLLPGENLTEMIG